jgi:hypothetical protein
LTPAGFWNNFHRSSILTKDSDQGPWGGHRILTWKTETKNTFTDHELIEFTDKNDWKLLDSISLLTEDLNAISFSKLKIDDLSQDILNEIILPKINTKDCKIFIFETTWLYVEPGNARETFQNGFVVMNLDGTELNLFHHWGG